MNTTHDARRRFLSRVIGAAGALLVAGCERLSNSDWFPKVLGAGEKLSSRGGARRHLAQVDGAGVHRRRSLAELSQQWNRRAGQRCVPDARRERLCRRTGSKSAAWSRSRRAFRWRTFARCRAARRSRGTIASKAGAPSRSGRARGSPRCSRRCGPTPEARFVVFHCADPMEDGRHQPLLRKHRSRGCVPSADDPCLRDERRRAADRQRGADSFARRAAAGLQAREVRDAIELVDSFARIAGGKGGYWEDQGYQWFAGI